MRIRRRPKGAAADHQTEQPSARLTGVRAVPHDDEERPRREDMDYGQTIFTRRPVPLPRWLRGRKHR